jgi:serine/threonine protein kinase
MSRKELTLRSYIDKYIEEKRSFLKSYILSIVSDCASGLAYLHQHGVTHMNLTPSSIFISPLRRRSEKVKCVIGSYEGANWKLGKENVIISLPHYFAPEVIESLLAFETGTAVTHTPQSDMWSLGMVVFTLLTLEVPYERDIKGEEILKEIVKGNRPPVVPDAIQNRADCMNVYVSCTHRDPKKRSHATDLLKRKRKSSKKS